MNNRGKYQTQEGNEVNNLGGKAYTGGQQFEEKILRKLNPDRNISNAYVCVEDMLDYDLVNLKAKVNTKSLSQLNFLKQDKVNVYLEDFAKFSNWFIDGKHLREHFEKPTTASDEINAEF